MKHYATKSWIDHRLKISESTISGKGIITIAPIKKDELLMVFGGEVVEYKDLDAKRYRIQTAFPIDVGKFIVLPVLDTSEAVDEYLNHSCDPSAWLIDEVTVIARRDMKTGDEVTVDVATWDMDVEWLYTDDGKCYCNARNCRKRLSPFDYQNIELQAQYAGHFSPYIQKQIDLEKKQNNTRSR